MSPESIIANLKELHRQAKLTPDNHETVKESISVISSLLGVSETSSEMTPHNAVNNIITLYNRVPMSLEEYEVLRQNITFVATKLPKEEKTEEAGAFGTIQEKKKK
jgi:tRNA C32,U32 (ribose-2'-O)-methylase TrmJ